MKQLNPEESAEDLVILFKTKDIRNNGTFYTDSNGLHMVHRQNESPLNIGKSYYPVNSAIFIEDDHQRLTYDYSVFLYPN